MAPPPTPSMSPGPVALMVTLVRGQMRIWPPRVSFKVAAAIPAESSEPGTTLMPVPTGWTAVGTPGTDANNSPRGAGLGVCPPTASDSNGNSTARVTTLAVFTDIESSSEANGPTPSARSPDETARLPRESDGDGVP